MELWGPRSSPRTPSQGEPVRAATVSLLRDCACFSVGSCRPPQGVGRGGAGGWPEASKKHVTAAQRQAVSPQGVPPGLPLGAKGHSFAESSRTRQVGVGVHLLWLLLRALCLLAGVSFLAVDSYISLAQTMAL